LSPVDFLSFDPGSHVSLLSIFKPRYFIISGKGWGIPPRNTGGLEDLPRERGFPEVYFEVPSSALLPKSISVIYVEVGRNWIASFVPHSEIE
jgi:hypothetical protein